MLGVAVGVFVGLAVVVLVGVTPGGLEKMFEERQGVDAKTNEALMRAHNVEVVGPPLQ